MSRRRRRNRGQSPRQTPRQAPQKKRPGKIRRFLGSIFQNRRNPDSHWVLFGDISRNFKEWLYSFNQRVPKGASMKWQNGKIVGHYTKSKWPC